MNIPMLTPTEVKQKLKSGAQLVDIRGRDEWEYEHIQDSFSVPLDQRLPDGLTLLGQNPSGCVIFHCQTGMRTEAKKAQCAALGAAAKVYLLKGGMNAWKSAGYTTVKAKRRVLPVMRQVQIVAGTLVVSGLLAGALWTEWLYFLAGFVGCGLIFAGITGWCGMAVLLERMPWNHR
ncbi:rhodanese family protein [Leclercia sp.]|uniref:rhodanese family protein n=1 Tax=Leclercia sp. TaxID=1898428 RepID=UPI0028BEEC13|nr:rhodanese family protein [Leclercia sp.]